MPTIRLFVLIVVLFTACTAQRPQAMTPHITSAKSAKPAEEEKQEYPNDLLELTVLGPLPEGCTTQVLYSYDNMNSVHLFMHQDRERPNRFYGPVLTSNFAPTFTVGSRCLSVYEDYDGTGYKEYHGPFEIWRKTVHGPWKKLDPRIQYEGWPSK